MSGIVSVRKTRSKQCSRARASAPDDEALLERREPARAIAPDGFKERQFLAVDPALEPPLIRILAPGCDVRNEIDGEQTAAPEDARDGCQRGFQIARRNKGLQHAVRREHGIERAVAKRQRPDVASEHAAVGELAIWRVGWPGASASQQSDRCRRDRRRRARAARTRDPCRSRVRGPAPERTSRAAARTTRRGVRASARSPSRRRARTRPSRPTLGRHFRVQTSEFRLISESRISESHTPQI